MWPSVVEGFAVGVGAVDILIGPAVVVGRGGSTVVASAPAADVAGGVSGDSGSAELSPPHALTSSKKDTRAPRCHTMTAHHLQFQSTTEGPCWSTVGGTSQECDELRDSMSNLDRAGAD